MIDAVTAFLGIGAVTLGTAALSGVIPILNLELYLVGVVAVGSRGVAEACALGIVAAAGQMIAKAVLYQAARGATNVGRRKYASAIDRARRSIARWRSKPLSVLFVSASVGLPPFYVVSLAAGMLEIRFRTFLAIGFAGRALRFATIAVLAALA